MRSATAYFIVISIVLGISNVLTSYGIKSPGRCRGYHILTYGNGGPSIRPLEFSTPPNAWWPTFPPG